MTAKNDALYTYSEPEPSADLAAQTSELADDMLKSLLGQAHIARHVCEMHPHDSKLPEDPEAKLSEVRGLGCRLFYRIGLPCKQLSSELVVTLRMLTDYRFS